VWSLEIVQRCGGSTYEQGRVGEERGGKETDRCPLTFTTYGAVYQDTQSQTVAVLHSHCAKLQVRKHDFDARWEFHIFNLCVLLSL
jgi:hypothetical protein